MVTISLIICSHKAPPSLWECLQSISAQTFKSGLEVVLVNNGFPQSKEDELRTAFASLLPELMICREDRPGLGFARTCGFKESCGEWLVLLDDDNSLAPDFLSQFARILEDHRTLGGICPAVYPIWEERPPVWLEGFGTLCLSYNQTDASVPACEVLFPKQEFENAQRPPGGGMVIHRSAVEAYLQAPQQNSRLALARTGDSLIGCEDADLWSYIPSTRRDVLASNLLRVFHHIPASRLRLSYLLRLNFQMQYSYSLLARLSENAQPDRPFYPALLETLVITGKLLKIAIFHSKEHPMAKQLLLIAQEWGRWAGSQQKLSETIAGEIYGG